MSDPVVTLNREGAVGIITFNRPPANSYDMNFVRDFTAAIDAAAKDNDVRAVVIKSALERFFSAGADLKFFMGGTQQSNMEMVRAEHESLEKISRIPKTFIAMIGGHCLGGGLEVALACDLRFSGDGNYNIGLPEVTLGLIPGNGGTQRLPRVIGKNRAVELMITGRAVQPNEALTLGIVDRVFPQAELAAKTMEYAQNIAKGASFAIGRIKLAVNEGIEMPLSQALEYERKVTQEVFGSADSKEGIAAFVEKRKPTFKGN